MSTLKVEKVFNAGSSTETLTLNADGSATIAGAATMSSTLGVTGATTLNGAATLNGATTLAGTNTISGTSTFSAPVVHSAGVSNGEVAITAGAGGFDLADGNFFSCGAIAVPNPSNAVAGTSGLIRFTATPVSFDTNFSTAPTITAPAIVPFYVQDATTILLGQAVGVA